MKILYITKSEKKVKEFKDVLKKYSDSIVTVDSLFDLEYDVILNTPSRDMEANVKKLVTTIWKKEKDNYDYVIADGYGLFSDFAPNILGVEADTWWPGTQRDRNEALVNLFLGVKEREIYYKSIFASCDNSGKVVVSTGYLYGYLARKVKEKNGEGYDSVFITKDGKYLSYYTPEEISKMSARYAAIEQLVSKMV
jgi:non-canonical purine NTP pyrophosphatase (RdgB/HAM1 family)